LAQPFSIHFFYKVFTTIKEVNRGEQKGLQQYDHQEAAQRVDVNTVQPCNSKTHDGKGRKKRF